MGGAVLFWGPLADRYGRRWVYLSSVGLFFGASFGCALAPTIEVLIAFRALQGATGARPPRRCVYLVAVQMPKKPLWVQQVRLNRMHRT